MKFNPCARPRALARRCVWTAMVLILPAAQARAGLVEPGEWMLSRQTTLNASGQYKQALDQLAAQRARHASSGSRAGKPQERRECLSPQDAARLTPQDMLQQLITSGQEGWRCTWTNKASDAQSYQIQYECTNPQSEVSKGLAQMRFDARSYHWALDSETQSPHNGQVSAHTVVNGQWLASQCSTPAPR